MINNEEKTKIDEKINTNIKHPDQVKKSKKIINMNSGIMETIDDKTKTNIPIDSGGKKILEKKEGNCKLTTNNKKMERRRRTSIIDINTINYLEKLINNNSFTEKDMKEYLIVSPDEMDFYDVLKKDKRSFWVYLINKIVKKQIIVTTFFVVEETIPKYLKIILLTLYIDLYFLINAAVYLPKDVSKSYYTEQNQYIFFFYNGVLKNIGLSFAITSVFRFIMELFLADKKSIRSVLKREKDDEKKFKKEIIGLIKSIKIRYILFIVINIIMLLLSWIYICCFNIAYPNMKLEWIALCVTVIIFAQILSVIFAFLETCIRFLAISCKIELLFTISKCIDVI